MSNEINKLLEILLDKTQEFGDRDDVAMDLSLYYNSKLVSDSLLHIIRDKEEDMDIVDRCLETLAEIICKQKKDVSKIDLEYDKKKKLIEYLSVLC